MSAPRSPRSHPSLRTVSTIAQLKARNAELAAQLQQCQQQLQQVSPSQDRPAIPVELPTESTFQSMVEYAPVLLWLSDQAGNCIFLNQTWLNFTGTPLTQQLGDGWADCLHAEDKQPCLLTYYSALRRQSAFQLEYRLRRYDGSYRWILDTGVPRFLPDGSFAGFLGSGVDITDRKQAEAVLWQREEQLRLTLDFTHIGSWDWHITTGEVTWNDNHARLLGLVPGEVEVTYQAWCDRVHPDDLARVEQSVVQALERQADFQAEYRIIHPDGSLHWLIGRGRGIYDAFGQAVRMVGVIVDITDRKQAEADLHQLNTELEQTVAQRTQELSQLVEALLQSEGRYRAIVEDQTELICRYLPNGVLTFVNSAYCRYFNKSPQELLNHRILPFILPEEQAQATAQIASLSQEMPFRSHEHQALLPSGELRWQFWTNRAIFDEQGQIIEYQAVGKDITDRKQAEAQLKTSLEEKEVLLKEIHHRVKNNLQMISSLLSLQANSIADHAALEPFNDSQRRIKAMALIHEKLYQSANLAQINFAEYVQSLAGDLFRAAVLPSRVALRLDVAAVELPVDIVISCGLILNELISNAIKYAFPIAQTGEIWIRFVAAPDDRYILTVADNGVGMPPESQLQASASLGLQLVRALIRKLRGTLTVNCEQGTHFYIAFGYSLPKG